MSFHNSLAGHSFAFSPIGHIPLDYPRMNQLCHAAHLRYEDHEVNGGENKPSYTIRTWRIVSDKPIPGGRVTATGHQKFCMLLRYIEHTAQPATRSDLYNKALDGQWSFLMGLSLQAMNDELCRKGVPGFDMIKRKAENDEF